MRDKQNKRSNSKIREKSGRAKVEGMALHPKKSKKFVPSTAASKKRENSKIQDES
jgi:hypothetical protein